MRDHILFHVNGREHRVSGKEAFTTLANWLRYGRGATGTKVVCEEGDCGACTVLVRRRGGDFLPINSCIQILAQLDGASIVTVEGLRMNAVQESMIVNQGAQCGYCTPGFVVAMSALFERGDRVNEKQVRDGLTGNLCRCTGYEPIIKAALAVDGASSPKLREVYPEVPDDGEAMLVRCHPERSEGPPEFFAPTTLADAIRFKRDHAPCTIVQGATDVGVWINKRNFSAPAMLSLGKIRELDEIRDERGTITAGANVTLAALESFVEHRVPELYRILNIFGSPQIKYAGTLIGNIANGSPIGDTLPYLFVADAELEIAGSAGVRRVPIERFYLGYKKFDLQPDEIITFVKAAALPPHSKLYKVSRRKDLDISAFTAAIRLHVEGNVITEARIAYGGVAPR